MTEPLVTLTAEPLTFSLLGRHLETRLGRGARLAWAAQALRAQWWFPEHRVPATPYRITVSQGPVAPPPGAAPSTVPSAAGPLRLRSGPDGFGFSDASGQLSCQHQAQASQIMLEPGAGAPSAQLTEALHLAVAESLRCSGLVPLHVAAAMRAGQTTAYAGPSGRGKSTTLLHALRAGGQPVAEDLVWADPHSGLIYGWERGVRLLPGSLHWLPPGLDPGPWPDGADKLCVPYPALSRAGVQRGGAALTRVLALERRPGQASALEPLSAREAALVLWQATGLPLAGAARQQLPLHLNALRLRAEFFRLWLGDLPLPLWPSDPPPEPDASRAPARNSGAP